MFQVLEDGFFFLERSGKSQGNLFSKMCKNPDNTINIIYSFLDKDYFLFSLHAEKGEQFEIVNDIYGNYFNKLKVWNVL